MGEYPVLKLTAAAGPLLRGEETLMLAATARAGGRRRRSPRPASGRGAARRGRGAARGRLRGRRAGGLGREADDEALFEELRTLRRAIADREGVPAYVIFHDATLREMAVARPQTLDEMLDVGGVGERKLEKYGEEFLAALGRLTAEP